MAKEQQQKAYTLMPNDSCTHVFTHVTGIPCSHTLLAIMEKRKHDVNIALTPELFHSHWNLYPSVENTTLEELLYNLSQTALQEVMDKVQEVYQNLDKPFKKQRMMMLLKNVAFESNLPILEPLVVKTRGRPSHAKSTKWNPSGFEFAESNYSCSICKAKGHNKRSFPTLCNK